MCLSDVTLKGVGPFCPVSMAGEVLCVHSYKYTLALAVEKGYL